MAKKTKKAISRNRLDTLVRKIDKLEDEHASLEDLDVFIADEDVDHMFTDLEGYSKQVPKRLCIGLEIKIKQARQLLKNVGKIVKEELKVNDKEYDRLEAQRQKLAKKFEQD